MYEVVGGYCIAQPPEKSEGKKTHTEIAQMIGDAQPARANGEAKAPLGIRCPDGEEIALSAKAADALKSALEDLLDNEALLVDGLGPWISPERAAHLLDLSDAEFRKLVKSGEIDCDLSKVATYVPLTEVLGYAERRAATQKADREKIEVDLWAMIKREREMEKEDIYPIRW